MRCSRCGGPLILTVGQTVVLPTVTLTTRDYEPVETETHDDAWCADCLREWDERTGLA